MHFLFQEQNSGPFNKRQPVVYPERDYDIDATDVFEQGNTGDRVNISQEELPDRRRNENEKIQSLQHDSSRNIQAAHENPDSLYQSGLILGCVKNLPEETAGIGSRRPPSHAALDSNYDIDDVANELIRLSEEQQSQDARL